jgi:hypothetical protein
VIALHDGMSKPKGAGAGCYARHATLAKLVGTDVSNFSKSLSRLVSWGYVAREPQLMDKRKFTLRVIYGDDDSWRADQQSPAEIVGEEALSVPEVVGEAEGRNGSFSRENGRHYISLKEELDSVETGKLNSSEEAQNGFCVDGVPASIFARQRKEDPAEAGLGRSWSLAARLPKNFGRLPAGAQVSKIEEAFEAIGRDPDRMDSRERETFTTFLYDTWDAHAGENSAIAGQAQRLYEEMAAY